MKTSLKLIALLLAAGYPCVALAQFAGAQIPAIPSAESVVGLFTAVFVGLMLIKDYSRPHLALTSTTPVVAPPADCFTCRPDRLAA